MAWFEAVRSTLSFFFFLTLHILPQKLLTSNTLSGRNLCCGAYLGKLSPRNPFERGAPRGSQWALTFSFGGAGYYTRLWRCFEWMEVACDRLRKGENFQAEWLSVPGLGRVEEEAVPRSRCGFNFFNSLT